MFRNVLFFRTLIDNSMMSMLKSFFPLTEYVKKDPQFGPVWEIIKTEFDLTTKLVLELADATSLMEDDKAGKASIQMRDKIVQLSAVGCGPLGCWLLVVALSS